MHNSLLVAVLVVLMVSVAVVMVARVHGRGGTGKW